MLTNSAKFGNFLAIFKQKIELRVYFRIFLHPDGSHENGAHENGARFFLPTVFLVFGIRFQNGAKECIV